MSTIKKKQQCQHILWRCGSNYQQKQLKNQRSHHEEAELTDRENEAGSVFQLISICYHDFC